MTWAAQHHRPLPWKGESDPYKIWLSEIILQQTRVEQGMPYYLKFVAQYPQVRDLADAPQDAVLKLWEGLGYYSRARNLHAAAKHIAYGLNSVFPATYEGLRALKGVGDYTAAAIASFAYGLPHAVVDGNVYRVLARYFGIATPTDTLAAKKEFFALAQKLLDTAQPGAYNQAIMDFGAGHCTPRLPQCPNCPLQAHCTAWQTNRVAELPLKSKALVKRERYFVYVEFVFGADTWVQKREGKDIWQNLYEFPMLETAQRPADRAEVRALVQKQFFPSGIPAGAELEMHAKHYRQVLTHQVVNALFCTVKLDKIPPKSLDAYRRIERMQLKKIVAVPRIIDRFLAEKSITLSLV